MTPESETPSLKREIREFLATNFLFGEADALKDDSSFLDANVLDSTGVLELVAFIEGKYGIKVQDSEMLPDNLDSIDQVVAFVRRKSAEGQAAAQGAAPAHKTGGGS